MEFITQKITDGMWSIDQNGVRSFLLEGTDKAVLVDTCFGGDIKAAVASITQKPVILVTTHADPDHIGCDHQFTEHYLHHEEFPVYESRSGKTANAIPIHDGDVFDIGIFRLEVVHIPGHTPGSIALLERQKHFLISGDTVQNNCIFMHGEGRDLSAFRRSIEKLECIRKEGEFDTVYPSHGPAVVAADILTDHLVLADMLLNGAAEPVAAAPEWFPDSVKTYGYNRAKMYY